MNWHYKFIILRFHSKTCTLNMFLFGSTEVQIIKKSFLISIQSIQFVCRYILYSINGDKYTKVEGKIFSAIISNIESIRYFCQGRDKHITLVIILFVPQHTRGNIFFAPFETCTNYHNGEYVFNKTGIFFFLVLWYRPILIPWNSRIECFHVSLYTLEKALTKEGFCLAHS